jgi:AcrR family transcriptional regulator
MLPIGIVEVKKRNATPMEAQRAMIQPTALQATRQRILDAADGLFRRVGIRGVGVEGIAEAAGTTKMTLYRHFESKDALIAEWMRALIAQKEAAWDEIVAEHPGDPAAQLVSWARRTAQQLALMEERGSPILNALAELPETDHPARRVIDEHRAREVQRLADACRAAGFAEPELEADQIYVVLEGAKACVQCIGLRRAGELLVRQVEAMVATLDAPRARPRATRR